MTFHAQIHPCPSALQRELAHTVVRMLPELRCTTLPALGERLQRTLGTEQRLVVALKEDAVEITRNDTPFITITTPQPNTTPNA